jgi:hypothetical protein
VFSWHIRDSEKGLYKSLGMVLKLGHLGKWIRSILTVLVCGGGKMGEISWTDLVKNEEV